MALLSILSQSLSGWEFENFPEVSILDRVSLAHYHGSLTTHQREGKSSDSHKWELTEVSCAKP